MGIFKQLWEVYKEDGSEVGVHRTVHAKLGSAPAVQSVLEEIEAFFAEEEMLLAMLSIGMFDAQSSFIGILLREEILQPPLVDLLLEKLSEYSAEMDAQIMEKNIPKLILRELRWMDHIVDSKQLIEKLLGALPAFSASLQRDIIYIIPEIANDEDSVIVVNAVLDLIRSDASLVVCCIEALGNFNVFNDQTSTVVRCVLERLDSSPLSDLPAVVKYLVQEAPATNVELIVDQLREKLSLSLAFDDNSTQFTTGETDNEEALILGIIVQGCYFREEFAKAFHAAIQSTESLRLLDVWILVGMHSIPQYQSKMETLFKKKVEIGQIKAHLLVHSIQSHTNALKSYFPSLLQLAGTLLSQTSADGASTQIGSLLYEVLFEEFSVRDKNEGSSSQIAFYQGEIISALLGHCLSKGVDSVAMAALDTFTRLVSATVSFEYHSTRNRSSQVQSHAKRRDRLKIYLPSLKQMLDTMENFSFIQVRKMYDVLFAIGGHDDSDLCNILRKQSFHQEVRYRCFGIIGSVSRLNCLLGYFREMSMTAWETLHTDENDDSEDVTALLPKKDCIPVNEMAKFFNRCVVELYKNCILDAKSSVFMLQELERFVKTVNLDKPGDLLVSIIFDYYMEVLSARFMDDFDYTKMEGETYRKSVMEGTMKADLWVSLDDKLSPVYLRILDLVVSPNISEQESLQYLSSLIGLVLMCARRRDQLTEIECVLVCPIQMMERSVIKELPALNQTVQNAVCSTLWHSINWIRSILNFFASEKKDYYIAKLTKRLGNLSSLEALLFEEVLESCPSFTTPGSAGGIESYSNTGKAKAVQGKNVGRPPKNQTMRRGLTDRSELIRNSFVPLKPEVANILAIPRLEILNAEEYATSESRNAVTLELPQVEFLFSLVASHIKHSLSIQSHQSQPPWRKGLAQSAVTLADDIFLFADDLNKQTTVELLEMYLESGVLDAAGNYARRFLLVLEDQQVEAENGHELSDDESIHLYRQILCEYLKIVEFVASHGVRDTSGHSSCNVKQYQQLQTLLLDTEDRIANVTPDSDVVLEIVMKCISNMLKFKRVVDNEIDVGVSLLQSLMALLSLAYGFNATQILRRMTVVNLHGEHDHLSNIKHVMTSQVSRLALSYLQKDWSRGDSKYAYKNAQVEIFLRCYLQFSPVVLDSIQVLAIDGFVKLLEQDGKRLEHYPTLDKRTVRIYHRVMLETMVAVTTRLDIDGTNDVQFVFNYLAQAVLLFKLLVCMTKSFQKAMIVGSVLKIGRKFIELILRVMPFFQEHFKSNTDRIVALIGDVQVATRRMQVLCAHGKLIKDQTAAMQVPMVKKLLETFIYRGEELARANGVLEAYTTGVLKNRRIDGTTIAKEELDEETEEEDEDSETDDDCADDTEDQQEGEPNTTADRKRQR